MCNKIRTIFRIGVEHGKDSLVLGAFGCGIYKLPVPDVVALFRRVMNEPEFTGNFRLLVFAIPESTRKPTKEERITFSCFFEQICYTIGKYSVLFVNSALFYKWEDVVCILLM